MAVRVLAVLIALGFVSLTACGGQSRYAGLTRAQAIRAAKAAIESPLDPSKRPYFEISIWSVAAAHASDSDLRPAWLVGIWNGQTESGACALTAARHGSTTAAVVSCAKFPKFAR